jgi:pimeloyl-ACP methyl ester carboxylesterase
LLDDALYHGMGRLAELRAVGYAARHLPGAVLRRGCETHLSVDEHNSRYPVVLVHGYAGSEAVWNTLRLALREAGFGYLVSLDYSCFAIDAAEVSNELLRQARVALARTGSPGIHLIGHSMGGLIVRQALMHRRLADVTASAVTIGTPHRGAPLARLAPGRCARIMNRRDDQANEPLSRPLRWLAYYSDGDRIVPTESARLQPTGSATTNVLIPSCGHMSLCRDQRLIASLVRELIRTEAALANTRYADTRYAGAAEDRGLAAA